MPLAAQLIEITGRINPREATSIALDHIVGAHQNNAPWSGGLDVKLISRPETGPSQRVGRNRRLVLAANARVSTPSRVLYFAHEK